MFKCKGCKDCRIMQNKVKKSDDLCHECEAECQAMINEIVHKQEKE